MKLGIINSAFAQAGKGTKFGIEQAAKLGFDTIDIFADPLETSAKEKKLIKKVAKDNGLPIKSVVCVALGLADFNNTVQQFHMKRCEKFLDFARELKADNLLLVLGEYIWQQEVIPPPVQWQMAVDNVKKLGKYAAKKKLEIALELEPFQLSLINTVDTMAKFLKDVGLKNVLANVDISHLHLMKIDPSEIAKLKGKIAHVHLSDCNGKTHGDLPPGRGVTPIKDYLKGIRDTGYNRTVSIELEYSPEPDRIVEWVGEAYRETDKIMQDLGCRN